MDDLATMTASLRRWVENDYEFRALEAHLDRCKRDRRYSGNEPWAVCYLEGGMVWVLAYNNEGEPITVSEWRIRPDNARLRFRGWDARDGRNLKGPSNG